VDYFCRSQLIAGIEAVSKLQIGLIVHGILNLPTTNHGHQFFENCPCLVASVGGSMVYSWHVQVDPLMAQRMATWVVWAAINCHRKMDDYKHAQSKKEWPRLSVPDNKGVSILVLGSGVMGGASAAALKLLGVPEQVSSSFVCMFACIGAPFSLP
jgi:hypothetical protein